MTESYPSLTKIDILTDNVTNIMDKLFFRATDGMTIDAAWDAPQPAMVNPLRPSEANEWGTSAMSITFARVASEPRRFGTRKVSRVSNYPQRSTAKPFYGYKSDPPKAKAYELEEPIGPAAKALKAAGTLAALAEANGESEDVDKIWDLAEKVWGPVEAHTREILKPSISHSSVKDRVKLVRSMNHMVYGFNSDAPAVGVDLGTYRAETIPRAYMVDWHAVTISLRFIGEYIARYHVKRPSPGQSIYFAPAFVEARIVKPVKYAEIAAVKKDAPTSLAAREIARVTLEHLQGVKAMDVARTELRISSAPFIIDSSNDVTVAALRKVAMSRTHRAVFLPKDVLEYREDRVVAEISSRDTVRFRDAILSNVNLLKAAWIPTWRSIHNMVWLAVMTRGFRGLPTMLSILRSYRRVRGMSEEERAITMKELADSIPLDVGSTIYIILRKLCPDVSEAQFQFIKMIEEIKDTSELTLTNSYASIYRDAFANTYDPERALNIMSKAFSMYESNSHGKTKVARLLSKSDGSRFDMMSAMREFLTDRTRYWANFYESRAIDLEHDVGGMVAVVKANKLKDIKISKIKVKEAATNSKAYMKYVNYEAEDMERELSRAKEKMITYRFLSSMYRHARFEIDSMMDTTVSVNVVDFQNIVKHSADNYARKRAKWGKKFSDSVTKWEKEKDDIYKRNRLVDIAIFADNILKPVVSWLSLLNAAKDKFKISDKFISRTLKALAAEHVVDDAVKVAAEEEEEEVAASMDPSLIGNYYAVLADTDSDEEIDHEIIVDAPVLNTMEYVDVKEAVKPTTVTKEIKDTATVVASIPSVSTSAFDDFDDFDEGEVVDTILLSSAIKSSDIDIFSPSIFEQYLREAKGATGDIEVDIMDQLAEIREYKTYWAKINASAAPLFMPDDSEIDIE